MISLKALPIVGDIVAKIIDVVAEVIPDRDKQAAIKAKIAEADFSQMEQAINSQVQVLVAELTGSKIQRSWRPHLMYLIMFFLVWLVIIVPALGALGVDIPIKKALESVPGQMWTILTYGLGGYVGLRSAEKMIDSWLSNRRSK